MNLNYFLFRILTFFPISFLRFIGYSKIGSELIMYLKKRSESNKKPYDVGNGIKMYIDYTDRRQLNLILRRDREKITKEVFLKNINKGDTIIDCGANIGEFSLLAARKVGPTGKVISIEPARKIATKLKENFLLNNFDNFKILELAVGDKPHKATLYEHGISEASSLDSTLLGKPTTGTSEIQVETLDNIISSLDIDKVDMIKIDVDAFEYETLLGCRESFSKNRIKNILCEVHYSLLKKRGINDNMIYDMLKKNGFSVEFIVKDEAAKVVYILASYVKGKISENLRQHHQ